jgi:polyisoprenoid-binding protein YceI
MKALLLALLMITGSSLLQAQTVYLVDPAHSAITYDMEHPAHAWSGSSHEVSGRIVVDAAGLVTAADVSAPVLSFDSGNRNRDSHMAETVEFYAYPNVTFSLTRLTSSPASTAPGAVAEGTITFHGVARPVRVPVRVERRGNRLHVTGQFDLTLTEFGLERPSLMMVRVRDWLRIHLDLFAVA